MPPNSMLPIDEVMMDPMMDIDADGLDPHSPVGGALEVAHNVSMEGGSTGTPKNDSRRVGPGPIFDETEFGPAGQGPQVHQSALVANNQSKNKK